MLRILFCLTLAAALLNACTIEKRTFRSGWHVEWKQRHHAVADVPEKESRAASEPAIRAAEAEVPVLFEEAAAEAVVPESAAAADASQEFTAAVSAAAVADVIEPVVSTGQQTQKQILPLHFLPKGQMSTASESDEIPASQSLWWIVAALVAIAFAATIWLAVGTGGSSGLLVALFVALVGSVIGAIVLSMHIKKTNPKEPEEDITFDDLTENEIKRKKKLKGLIAALVLVVVGVGIILIGSK